jgi:hypothetical protein
MAASRAPAATNSSGEVSGRAASAPTTGSIDGVPAGGGGGAGGELACPLVWESAASFVGVPSTAIGVTGRNVGVGVTVAVGVSVGVMVGVGVGVPVSVGVGVRVGV